MRDQACHTSGVRPGIYRHFKGHLYEVEGTALQVDSENEFVIYKQLYDDFRLFLRDKDEFLEIVEVDGIEVPRFQFIRPTKPGEERSWLVEMLARIRQVIKPEPHRARRLYGQTLSHRNSLPVRPGTARHNRTTLTKVK